MRIGVDARELAGKPTGIGRYLAELLLAWDLLAAAQPHRFVLYAAGGSARLPEQVRLLVERSALITFRNMPGAGGTIWEQWTLANAAARDHLDAFLAPAYTAPLRLHVPVALTIHDLSFVAHSEWFGAREGLRRRLLTRWSAQRAAMILTDSEFSRREIVDLLGVPATRVRCIRLGVTAPTCSPSSPHLRHQPGPAKAGHYVEKGPAPTARAPLVLFVGSLFNRRRIPDLIAAFALIVRKHPEARLALVGENRTYPRQDPAALAIAAGVAERVEIHEYVPDDVLADLYGRARVFVFLSEYEGFGLTPLEALAAGIPVVVLDTPIAREIHGEAATFVARGDVHGTAAAIETLMFDEQARTRQLSEAARLLPAYSWDRAATETLEAIVDMVRTRSPSRSFARP